MGKKNVLAALFLLGVLSFMTSSAGSIQYLRWADTGIRNAPCYSLTPIDTTVSSNYDPTSPVLTFHVPAVPMSCHQIFFDWCSRAALAWTATDAWRGIQVSVQCEISSNAIPAGIMVQASFHIYQQHIYHGVDGFGGNQNALSANRIVMDRTVLGDWFVDYTAGGGVPPATALKIINRIMNQGFNVSVYPYGHTGPGVGKLEYVTISVLVTGN
jgi:hypothetical protein